MQHARYRPDSAPKKSPAPYTPPSYGYRPTPTKPRTVSPQHKKAQASAPHHQKINPADSRAAKSSISNTSQGSIPARREPQQRQELLVMTIDLGDGTKDLLRVCEGDDPFQLAVAFCERHQLNLQLVEPLAQNIYGNMEQVLQESVQTLNMAGGTHETEQLGAETRHSADTQQQDTGKFRNLAEMGRGEAENLNYANQGDYEEYQQQQQYQQYQQQQYQYQQEKSQHQQQYHHKQERDRLLANSGLKGEDRHSLQGYQARESAHSKKYDDEAEMYEMIDHGDDNGELIAERVSPKNMAFRNDRNGLTEKDLRLSSQQSKLTSPQQQHFSSEQRQSGQFGNSEGERKNEQKLWASGEEFQNEEEYLDYLVQSQYGVGKEKQPGRYDLTFVPNINQNSRQILEQKAHPGKGTVYDRLHEESKIKNSQQTALRQSHSAQKTNSSTIKSQYGSSSDINYGTLLYHRGLKKSEELKKSIIEKRKEKIDKVHKECTFKPELNKISQQIMSTKARYENIPDMLIRSGKDSKDKLERARSAKKTKEIEECTFHPEINFISQRIDSEKSKMTYHPDQDRFGRLYHESRVRQEQQEVVSRMLPAEYTFKPAIKNYKSNAISQTTFEQRDQKFRDRMERINYMRQLKDEAEVRDPETGEPLFRPKTGRSPRGRNSGNLPIGDYLYLQQYKIAENKRRLHESQERSVRANMARSSETSHYIVENLMRRRLEDIFRRFDSDGDGCISSAKIDITNVGNDVLETLAPILCEMEERNQILDFEGFCEQIDRLFRFLTVAEKDKLLLGKKEVSQEVPWSFQPEIDKRSERIAQRKHPYGDFHSLYGSYVDEKRKFNQKVRDQQERKNQEQLKECSFKPTLYTSPKAAALTPSGKRYAKAPGNNYFMDDLLI